METMTDAGVDLVRVKHKQLDLDGGHWLLETSLNEVAPFIRGFLGRVHAA
ncbi:hypothetical protein J2046_000796 [Rhizobium petrolearium]|nr:hypothetical protein [Neorhizobium petrolearium]